MVSASSIFGPNGFHQYSAKNFIFQTWNCSASVHHLGFPHEKDSTSIYCIHVEYSLLALPMIGIASTIMYSFLFLVWKRCDATRFLTGTGDTLLPVIFGGVLVGL